MITINTNKGLAKIEGWDDVISRPGFTDNLDPAKHELASIVGRYVFGDMIRCGLSNCHTPHARGYIVATKDGRETNIGKDCGKNYFGVDFELQAKQFDRDITEQENRELLWNFSFQLEELSAKIAEIRSGETGADWVNKHCQALLGATVRVPKAISRKMAEMVKTKSSILYSQRMATKIQIEELEAIQGRHLPRPHYIDEPVAEIVGIEALYPENNLRELLVIQLEENIKIFSARDIDQMTYDELARWKKWAVSVDLTLERACASVVSGRVLLASENLIPLLKLSGLENDDEMLFQKFLDAVSGKG